MNGGLKKEVYYIILEDFGTKLHQMTAFEVKKFAKFLGNSQRHQWLYKNVQQKSFIFIVYLVSYCYNKWHCKNTFH